MNIPKVKNMKSMRGNGFSGNSVPNQFEILTEEGIYFQSYKTVIAFKSYDNDDIVLDQDKWDYSQTAARYRNMFLGETKKETEAKIKSGEYKLGDLNK